MGNRGQQTVCDLSETLPSQRAPTQGWPPSSSPGAPPTILSPVPQLRLSQALKTLTAPDIFAILVLGSQGTD